MKKKPDSYLALAVLASGVMYFALRLSRSGRTAIDWTVIGLVAAAIGWNLVQLGRRLQQLDGGKSVWHLLRTITFWIVGLLNSALIRPEDVGGWKNWIGWGFIALAVFDMILLGVKERSGVSPPADESGRTA